MDPGGRRPSGALVAGIPVADVGCGLGASTRILADTYPASSVRGFDPYLESIELACKAAVEADLAELRFQWSAQDFPGRLWGWQRSIAARQGTRSMPPATPGRPSMHCSADRRALCYRLGKQRT